MIQLRLEATLPRAALTAIVLTVITGVLMALVDALLFSTPAEGAAALAGPWRAALA